MRKVENGFWRRFHEWGGTAGLMAGLVLLSGCASGPTAKEKLAGAYQQLDSANPNYAEIAGVADTYLQENPEGPAAADALYLHGRALEEKSQRDLTSPQKDTVDAYNYYSQALTHKPRPGLEGLIHVGMGNVLYFQDRYAAALNELTAGYEKLERDSDKAWALYRIGLCDQRLGQWSEADRNFTLVQQQFPNTVQAQRAREHVGHKAFWVQVGTYASPASADGVTAELKKQGLSAQRFIDTTRNAQVVRVGPLNSYESAVATKQKVWGKYRDALIVP